MKELTLEVNQNFTRAADVLAAPGMKIAMTPPLDEDYYIARVALHKDQAIQCFPKFFTVGCGFAQEEDWNTNLPLTCPAAEIFAHIAHNKKYEEIIDADCIRAIEILQAAILPLLGKQVRS